MPSLRRVPVFSFPFPTLRLGACYNPARRGVVETLGTVKSGVRGRLQSPIPAAYAQIGSERSAAKKNRNRRMKGE